MKVLTYLGNKRRQLDEILGEVKKHTANGLVLDLFSGSGVVAAHLKEKGYVVHANDIAPYSFPINRVHLELTPISLASAYPELDRQLAAVNTLTTPPAGEEYFSVHYSENPKAKYQRLYYTIRNGLFIDSVLCLVHQLDDSLLKDIILSDLLYKMSVRANNSGHFKTFHKKFGGLRNTHDLARIMTDITIEWPEIPEGPLGKAFCMEATSMIRESNEKYDLIYLDPPYNQHQYSANYHLLEYACYPKSMRYVPKDSQVSGIDPKLFKSRFCSKLALAPALREVIDACTDKTGVVLISFHDGGYIDLKSMTELVGDYGKVEVKPSHVKDEYLMTLVCD